jgi:1-phosphofructokinase
VTTRTPTERARVAVFDPTPVLTIVVESVNGTPDVHLHAGGQGVWVARMLLELGVDAVLCAPIGGETGVVLSGLARDEGIELASVDSPGACGAYINDRRSGKREEWVAMPPAPLGRHVLDELYGLFLGESTGASAAVLTGPREAGALPADTYRRLAGDCRELGAAVVADLAGEALTAALAGGLTLLKVSEEELRAHGRLGDDAAAEDVVAAAWRLRDDGADHVVISRGGEAAIAVLDGQLHWAHGPQLSPADHRGAGDSMTAGITAGIARRRPLTDAVRLGVAAGAVTVSRHGLATGDRRSIERLISAVLLEQGPTPPVR